VYVENSDKDPNSIIQLNIPILRREIASTNDYRIIEIIFTNFNLFPQINQTNQTDNSSDQLLGIPISYQIANWTTIKTDEDLVRFQIRVPEVRKFHLKKV
jgi:hypothetical protein